MMDMSCSPFPVSLGGDQKMRSESGAWVASSQPPPEVWPIVHMPREVGGCDGPMAVSIDGEATTTSLLEREPMDAM